MCWLSRREWHPLGKVCKVCFRGSYLLIKLLLSLLLSDVVAAAALTFAWWVVCWIVVQFRRVPSTWA